MARDRHGNLRPVHSRPILLVGVPMEDHLRFYLQGQPILHHNPRLVRRRQLHNRVRRRQFHNRVLHRRLAQHQRQAPQPLLLTNLAPKFMCFQ